MSWRENKLAMNPGKLLMTEIDRRARHERHFIPQHNTQRERERGGGGGIRDATLDIFVAILD